MVAALSSLTSVLAFSWEPEIRGIITVAIGVVVLCGSVYLLVATNTGHRMGFLIALTGLMGWMTLLGLVWSMYGIGYTGPGPSWEVLEINRGDLDSAGTDVAQQLPNAEELPEPQEFLSEAPELAESFEGQPGEPTLGELLTVDESIATELELGGWNLLSPSDTQTGEAQAAAEVAVGPEGTGAFATTEDYVLLNTFDLGGKDPLTDESLVGRVTHRIESILTLRHPPHYAVVQLAPAVPQEAVPGEAPPIPEIDEDRPVYSVIMLRDLGALRLPPIGITIFCGIIFAVLCNILHRRDKVARAARADAGASPL